MAPATSPERGADLRLAELVLDLLPLIGRFTTATLREQEAPSPERMRLIIRIASGPIRAGELAQSCFLSPATVSELVESLVQDGHLRRDTDPSDRRAVVIELTDAGAREYQRVRSALARRIVRRLSSLSPDQRTRLAAAFGDLHDLFTGPPTPREPSRNVR